MDWASHEQHLLEQYALRCAGRPYQSSCFSAVHGCSPVTFAPKYVALLTTTDLSTVPKLELFNNSTTNTVRFSLAGTRLPEWVVVAPIEGLIPPGGKVALEFTQNNEAADKMSALT